MTCLEHWTYLRPCCPLPPWRCLHVALPPQGYGQPLPPHPSPGRSHSLDGNLSLCLSAWDHHSDQGPGCPSAWGIMTQPMDSPRVELGWIPDPTRKTCCIVPSPSGSLAPLFPPHPGALDNTSQPMALAGLLCEAWAAPDGQQCSGCSPSHIARLESWRNVGIPPHLPHGPPQPPATGSLRSLLLVLSIYFNAQV